MTEPATARQKFYATDLGLKYHRNIRIDEISDMIESSLSLDHPSPQKILDHARRMNVRCTTSTGYNALTKRMWEMVNRYPDRLAEFYCWMVACRMRRKLPSDISSLLDTRIIKSMRSMPPRSPDDWSTRSIAYQECRKLILAQNKSVGFFGWIRRIF